MFDRKILKSRAKLVLSHSFFTSLIACAITAFAGSGIIGMGTNKLQGINFVNMSNIRIAAIFAVVGLLALAGIAFFIFVTAPLSVGLKYFMLRSADGHDSLENLLFPFKNSYKNIVLVLFVKYLYIFLWSLVGAIPLAIGVWKFGLMDKIQELVIAIQNDSFHAAFSLLAMMSGLSLLTIIFSIPGMIKELQYSMVEYILADSPHTSRHDAIFKSKEMMVGNKWAYVKLLLSFLGWQLAANAFCCLGAIIVRPYIEATTAQMYLEISGQGKDYTNYEFEQKNPFGGFGGFGGFGNM